MYTYQQVCGDKKRVLFVTAHPDDSGVFFGALISQLRSEGKEVYVLLVTTGARGSRDDVISENLLAEKRLAEETACLSVLGVAKENIFCLGYADGEVESDLTLIGQIAYYLRTNKIDLVATHEPTLQYVPVPGQQGFSIQHRDHRKIGEAVLDAVYPFALNRSFFPEHAAQGVEPHTVLEVLLTPENGYNLEFDFTDTCAQKRTALAKHASQFSAEIIERILTMFARDGRNFERYSYIKLLR